MSFLPAPFAPRAHDEEWSMGSAPVVHIRGSMDVAEQRWGQFAHAYSVYANSTARNSIHRFPAAKYSFLTGDTMTVVSDGVRDHVVIEVVDEDSGTSSTELLGFVVVPMNDDKTGPDNLKTSLYDFDFDATGFASTESPNLFEGKVRRFVGD